MKKRKGRPLSQAHRDAISASTLGRSKRKGNQSRSMKRQWRENREAMLSRSNYLPWSEERRTKQSASQRRRWDRYRAEKKGSTDGLPDGR